MGKIIEAADLPEHDKVYLKKDIFGWRTVQPLKNTEGKIILINLLFGGWRNLLTLIILFLLVGFMLWSFNHDIQEVKSYYGNISEDPFYACSDPSDYQNYESFDKERWQELELK